MSEFFALEMPLWEIVLRGMAVYVGLAVVLRLIPKRQAGNVSPNDMIALVLVGSLAADSMMGGATGMLDVFLMAVVVLLLDYGFNLLEYYFPRWQRVAQDSPTLLIHNGQVLTRNLAKEKLTEQELAANLRKQGIDDVGRVKQAILETDGHISVIEKEDAG